jgi:hypothetical protein
MGNYEEGRPEYRRSNREVIVEVARAGAESRLRLAILVKAAFSKTIIGRLVVMGKIQTALDEWCAGIRVVANTVAPYPWFNKGIVNRKITSSNQAYRSCCPRRWIFTGFQSARQNIEHKLDLTSLRDKKRNGGRLLERSIQVYPSSKIEIQMNKDIYKFINNTLRIQGNP